MLKIATNTLTKNMVYHEEDKKELKALLSLSKNKLSEEIVNSKEYCIENLMNN